MIAEIIRLETSKHGTLGVMRLSKEVFCFTLELPDKGNERSISSIPTGQYECKRRESGKFGTVIHVQNVWNRSLIYIHPGNYVTDTRGCILVGRSVRVLNQGKRERCILNSGRTHKSLLAIAGEKEFKLAVSEHY